MKIRSPPESELLEACSLLSGELKPGTLSPSGSPLLTVLQRLAWFLSDESDEIRSILIREIEATLSLYYWDGGPRARRVAGFLQHVGNALRRQEGDAVISNVGWLEEVLPDAAWRIPTMIQPSTMRYYAWLGRNIKGIGHVVELGCFLGGATACLVHGMRKNNAIIAGEGKSEIHVFDSFRWFPWMANQDVTNPDQLPVLQPRQCFREHFERACAAFVEDVHVHEGALPGRLAAAYEVPAVRWTGGAVELLVVDFGDEYTVSQELWLEFSPSLIPGESIVVFQQYGLLRSQSVWRFCEDHRSELAPLHRPTGTAKSFRFIGRR